MIASSSVVRKNSPLRLLKNCNIYDDNIGTTIACGQTLIGGMISRGVGSVGGGVQIRATNAEANELFKEWQLALDFTELKERFPEVIGRISDPEREDMLFHLRAQEMMEKMNNLRWRNGYAVAAVSLACKGRRFYKSNKGFMDLAPVIDQKEDMVCPFLGCCTPLIIRGGGSKFPLVGESYVPGVMDGELMSDAALQNISFV